MFKGIFRWASVVISVAFGGTAWGFGHWGMHATNLSSTIYEDHDFYETNTTQPRNRSSRIRSNLSVIGQNNTVEVRDARSSKGWRTKNAVPDRGKGTKLSPCIDPSICQSLIRPHRRDGLQRLKHKGEVCRYPKWYAWSVRWYVASTCAFLAPTTYSSQHMREGGWVCDCPASMVRADGSYGECSFVNARAAGRWMSQLLR